MTLRKKPWTSLELKVFKKLSSPYKIQLFLDSLKYNIDDITRSPRQVLLKKRAHCFDGAIFAAAGLECLGYVPTLLDLRANSEDDDHVLAIFKQGGCFGAVAKSNYVSCRYRDPIYRTIRELALSYFDRYFNLAGRKTLREYSVPFDLRRVKDIDWRTTEADLDFLGPRLDATRHHWLFTKRQEKIISPADERSFKAETLGLDPRGAFKVRGAKLK